MDTDFSSFPEAWMAFFRAGTTVVALPGWDNPLLLIPLNADGGRLWAWRAADLYPATKLTARLRKLTLKFWAVTGLSERRIVQSAQVWPLGEFVRDALPSASRAVVLFGHHRSSPVEKVKFQLWNEQDEIVGYIKYAEKPKAIERLQGEAEILTRLPQNLGPGVLKFGQFHRGWALVLAPIIGRQLRASSHPPADAIEFCERMRRDATHSIYEHPKIINLKQRSLGMDFPFAKWLSPLENKCWPVTIQHGDYAPWNLMRVKGAELRAYDWEFASLEGFPYLDLAYWILQVASLVSEWQPERAFSEAVCFLTHRMGLLIAEAESIVRLTALELFVTAQENGRGPHWPLQRWRRRLLE